MNRNGFGPAFQHPILGRVGWHGGGFTGYFTSYEGMKAEAVAARSAAQTAASNASAAAQADLASRIAAGELKGDKGADGSNVLPTDNAIEQAIKTPASKTATALSATYATAAAVAAKLDSTTAATTYALKGEAGNPTALESQRAETMRLAFTPPLPQDYPTLTVIGTASTTMTGTTLREKRIGDNTANGADLAGDTRYRYSGTPSLDPTPADPTNFVQAPLIPGGSSQAAYYAYTVGTITAAANSELEIRFRAPVVGVSYRLQIDGKHYSMEAIRTTGLTAGSWYYIRLAFPIARSRHVKITFEGNIAFSGLKVPTGQELYRPAQPISKRVAIIGDSFASGASTRPDGATRLETAPYLAALMLGADAIWHIGLGGTGYTTANPFNDRVATAVAAAPHIVIVDGSRNDGTADTAGLRTAVDTVMSGLSSIAEVYVTGPSTAAYAGNNSAVKARAVAAGRKFVDSLIEPWINTATMIGTDTIHLNWLGHQRRASRLHESITALKAP